MRTSGNMLIINDNGLILGVSRKDNPNSFGIAGGKSEPGETPKQAAIRETKEETSIEVTRCVQIFNKNIITKDGQLFAAYCFYALDWSGEPKQMEEGKVQWITEEQLTSPDAAFPVYNAEMLKVFRLFDRKK